MNGRLKVKNDAEYGERAISTVQFVAIIAEKLLPTWRR
jgi:hypothetical protein